MKNEMKITIVMAASFVIVFLLVLQFLGIGVNRYEDALVGSTIGGNKEPICLWVMRNDNYNLVATASFCNRLFARYAADGQCSGTPGVVEWTSKQGNPFKFAYDGYCSNVQGGNPVAIYSGVLV